LLSNNILYNFQRSFCGFIPDKIDRQFRIGVDEEQLFSVREERMLRMISNEVIIKQLYLI